MKRRPKRLSEMLSTYTEDSDDPFFASRLEKMRRNADKLYDEAEAIGDVDPSELAPELIKRSAWGKKLLLALAALLIFGVGFGLYLLNSSPSEVVAKVSKIETIPTSISYRGQRKTPEAVTPERLNTANIYQPERPFDVVFTSPRDGFAAVAVSDGETVEFTREQNEPPIICLANQPCEEVALGLPDSPTRYFVIVSSSREFIDKILQSPAALMIGDDNESSHQRIAKIASEFSDCWVGTGLVIVEPFVEEAQDETTDDHLESRPSSEKTPLVSSDIDLSAITPEQAEAEYRKLSEAAEQDFYWKKTDDALDKMKKAMKLVDAFESLDRFRVSATSNLGAANWKLGNFEVAATYLGEAIKLGRERATTDEAKQDLINALNGMGAVRISQRNPDKAIPLFVESTQLLKTLATRDKLLEIRTANNLGDAWLMKRHLTEAKRVFEESLREFGEPDVKVKIEVEVYARSKSNLGKVLFHAAQYHEARRLFEESVFWRKQIDSPALGISLNNLGSVLYCQREFEQAKECFRESLELYDGLPNGFQQMSEIITTLGNLARMEMEVGDFEASKAHLDEAERRLAELEKSKTVGLQIQLLFNQAMYFILDGNRRNVEDAKAFYLEALSVMRQARRLMEMHGAMAMVATADIELGEISRLSGELDDSVETFTSVIDRLANVYPEGHPHLSIAYRRKGLALIHRNKENDRSEGIKALVQAADMNVKIAASYFSTASEAQALNFATSHLRPAHALISLKPDPEYGLDADEQYKFLWNFKGIVHRFLKQRTLKIQGSKDQKLAILFDQWTTHRQNLARMVASTNQPPNAALEQIQASKEETERQIAQILSGFDSQYGVPKASHQELQEQLADNEVFIDIIHYLQADLTKPTHLARRSYAAFVLQNQGPPMRVPLGDAQTIDDLIKEWRKSIQAARSFPKSKNLADLIWKPIRDQFRDGVTKLYLCPDGLLTATPWVALPTSKDRLLIEDYEISFVPFGEQLYSSLTREPAAGLTREEIFVVTDQSRRDDVIRNLPNAKLVRVETHGFFEEGGKENSILALDPKNYNRPQFPAAESRITITGRSPLVLCGLRINSGESETAETGIILGEEIVALPLHKMEFAGLWACETGVGDVAGGEGVFSLIRSFLLAGTKSAISGQWIVDDEKTKEISSQFETYWLEKGMSKAAALRQAQLDILNGPKRYRSPYFWAAWQLSGDAR